VNTSSAWLSEEAAKTIEVAAREHHPNEIGGVLLGVSVAGRPWITEATVVPTGEGTPTYYELPAGARHQAVDRARERDARLGYLGDWHSHPADIGPSGTDRGTMRELATQGDCPEPLLLLARRQAASYELDAHQQTRRKLGMLELVAAGSLPVQQRSALKGAHSGRSSRHRSRRRSR
jgi:proteasome lid subunit RPN8/RPN11